MLQFTTVWIAISGGVFAIVATCGLLIGSRRRRRPHDLGVISAQWIAQHRAASYDPGH